MAYSVSIARYKINVRSERRSIDTSYKALTLGITLAFVTIPHIRRGYSGEPRYSMGIKSGKDFISLAFAVWRDGK